MARGQLIAVDGLDLTGKSTLIKNIVVAKGIQSTSVLGGCPFTKTLRELFITGDYIDATNYLLLFMAAARETYRQVINPALEKGDSIIIDRWMISGYLHNPIESRLPVEVVNSLLPIEMAADINIVLTAPEAILRSRLKQRGGLDARESDLFEKNELVKIANRLELFRTKELFTTSQPDILIASHQRSFWLDGSRSEKCCLKEALSIINAALGDVNGN